MKKSLIALTLILSASTLSAAESECGMKNGKIDPESYELCAQNVNINIQKHVRNKDVATSFVLSGNEAQTVSLEEEAAQKYVQQESIMNDARTPINNLTFKLAVLLVIISIILFLFYSWWGLPVTIGALVGSVLGGLLLQLPSWSNDKQKLLETLASDFGFIGEKIATRAARTAVSLIISFGENVTDENGKIVIDMPISSQYKNIIKLQKNYEIMRQTDKAYKMNNSDSDIYANADSFIQVKPTSIDFIRYQPDSTTKIQYNLTRIPFAAVDLEKYGSILKDINKDAYVTDNVDEMEAKLEALSTELYRRYDKTKEADNQRANNIISDFISLNTTKIRQKMIIDNWSQLEQIYQLRLQYTCYNSNDVSFGKNFIRTSGQEGRSDCLYMNNGAMTIAAGEYDASRFDEKTDSEIQITWLNKIDELTLKMAESNKKIEDKLASVAANAMRFNDVDFYVEKVAKGGSFTAILYLPKIIYFSQFKTASINSIAESSLRIAVKDVGASAVDMTQLSKASTRGNVLRTLNFATVDKKLMEKLNLADLDSGSTTEDISAITEAYFNANGTGSETDLLKSLILNPAQKFYKAVGIEKGCFADCEIFKVLPTYALANTGSEMLIKTTQYQVYMIGIHAANTSIDKIAVKRDYDKSKSSKAQISDKKQGKSSSGINKILGIMTSLFTWLLVIPQAIGFMLAIVNPILEKAPFFAGMGAYYVFACLAPILLIFKTLSVIMIKKEEQKDFTAVFMQFLAVAFILLFEPMLLIVMYILSIYIAGVFLWFLAMFSSLTVENSGMLGEIISFCIFIIMTMTTTSVVAVICATMNNQIYNVLGFSAVHNKSTEYVNAKFDAVIFKIFPSIFILTTIINSFGITPRKRTTEDRAYEKGLKTMRDK